MKSKKKASIGLVKEYALPDPFTAQADLEKETVEISRPGYQPIKIALNSFASVSNALAVMWKDTESTWQPGSTLEIKDVFSGRSTTVTANALDDVANVLKSLATSQGKYLPESTVVATAKPKQKRVRRSKAQIEADNRRPQLPLESVQDKAESLLVKSTDTKETEKPSNVVNMSSKTKPAAKTEASEPTAAASTKVGRKAKTQTPPPAPISSTPLDVPAVPKWFKSEFKDKYDGVTDQNVKFELVRTALALTAEKSRYVNGKGGEAPGPIAWGYEIVSNGKHVAWVIVENERSIVITGTPGDDKPQPQRLIDGVIARIIARVMPKFIASTKAA